MIRNCLLERDNLSPEGHFNMSQSVLKWVKLNQLMADGPCRNIGSLTFRLWSHRDIKPVGARQGIDSKAFFKAAATDTAMTVSQTDKKEHGHGGKLERV